MNKKTIIILTLTNFLVLSFFVVLMLYFFGKNSQNLNQSQATFLENPLQNQNTNSFSNSSQSQEASPVVIEKKEEIPPFANGVVEEIDSEKLVLKQYADFDFKFVYEKRDIASVKKMIKNPDFDEEKTKEAQKVVQSRMSQIKPEDKEAQEIFKKEMEKIMQDETLQQFKEEIVSWKEVKQGLQVMIRTEKDQSRTLFIYPKEYPIDYSKSPSEVKNNE